MQARQIQKVWTTHERVISPIHRVSAVLEPGYWENFDPFLLMMEDTFKEGAFGIHPHRGMETITYVIEGSIEHFDSASGQGDTLTSGDFQMMTAGRGVEHNEKPAPGETVHVLQLWVNLPRKDKMTEPRYQNVRKREAPVRKEEGALIRVYSGASGETVANTLNYVPVTFVEMIVDSGATVIQDLPGSYNGFIYVLEGSGAFGENKVEASEGQVLWLGAVHQESMSFIHISAKDALRIILFAGEPIKEPVVARGPFVMNTFEEITQAYDDYRSGNFIK